MRREGDLAVDARRVESAREAELTPLAKRLYTTLTDGAPRLRFQIARGFWLREIGPDGKPHLDRHARTDEWRPARDRFPDGRETDRTANPFVLLQHLLGRYDVAIEAPSWASLHVFDVDRPHVLGTSAGVDGQGRPFRPAPNPDAEVHADQTRDAMLAALWRAYGFNRERQPVVTSSPGAGYHVWLPHCRDVARRPDQQAWPVAWARQHHEHHLHQHGLGLAPGRLELFPTGVPLRAPCGRGTALLVPTRPDDPDDLGLVPLHAQWVERWDPKRAERRLVLERDVPAYVRAFLERLEAARRPLEEWLSPAPPRPAWGPVYGPWGTRADHADWTPPPDDGAKKKGGASSSAGVPSRHIGEVLGAPRARRPQRSPAAPGPFPPLAAPGRLPLGKVTPPVPSAAGPGSAAPSASGAVGALTGGLLHGHAWRLAIAALIHLGLQDAHTRHDGVLKVAWHLHRERGLDAGATLTELEAWLRTRPHQSQTLHARGEGAFVADCLREARHYLFKHLRADPARAPTRRPGQRLRGAAQLTLRAADLGLLTQLPPELRDAAQALLVYALTYADEQGRVPHPIDVGTLDLERLCGHRRLRDADGRRRRVGVLALEALEQLGVFALHLDYSVGHHTRRYTVWYEFGSGQLPAPLDAVTAALPTEEATPGGPSLAAARAGTSAADRSPEEEPGLAPGRAGAAGLVLARRAIAEGEILVVSTGPKQPPTVRFARLRPGLMAATTTWWHRMYARRAFTPAEFFEATERRVLPGPFRDRRPVPPGARPTVADKTGAPLPAAPPSVDDATVPAPAATEPRLVRGPGESDRAFDLRCQLHRAVHAGDHGAVRRLAQHHLEAMRAARQAAQPGPAHAATPAAPSAPSSNTEWIERWMATLRSRRQE